MRMRWKKIDQATQEIPSHLNLENDICYYAREYVAEGYVASNTNSAILNFKKSPSVRDTAQWPYREQAVQQFAAELSDFFQNAPLSDIYITWIPSSKNSTDPEYDHRFEDLFTRLVTHLPEIHYGNLIISEGRLLSSHHGGPRDPSSLSLNFTLNQNTDISSFRWVVIVDDVITSGSHFKVCKNLILEKFPEKNIAGVFWAKTIHR